MRKNRLKESKEKDVFLNGWKKDPSNTRAKDQTFTWVESEKHEEYLHNLNMSRCLKCGRTKIRDFALKNGLCQLCNKHKKDKSVNPFSSKVLHMTRPKDLPELNEIEIQFISRACLIVNVHRLSGGQKGYKGHVISIYQDVQKNTGKVIEFPNEISFNLV